MTRASVHPAPPFCPNPECRFHRADRHLWKFVRIGFYSRQVAPFKVQRYKCDSCRRRFGDQTFSVTYWLRRPELFKPIFFRLLSCSCYRQIAREWKASPQTIARQAARLGRHCLLFHEAHRPKGPLTEPLALDSFESFEYSQYYPTSYHLAIGQQSHFMHGLTASECRRRGSMTKAQKRRREELERTLGKPDPRAVEKDVAAVLSIVAPTPQALELHTDEHKAYPRALRRVPHLRVDHRTISSRAARTPRNPLFAVNLADLLIRHSGSNHKRETIAWSKRRASSILRLFVLVVWRNWVKPFSEQKGGSSPAMKLGLIDRRLDEEEILDRRLFATRIALAKPWQEYYAERPLTRAMRRCSSFERRYAG